MGRRRVRRSRLSWMDEVEFDLRDVGVERWRTRALDNTEWISVLRKTKAKLEGVYC
jgi:hypothetical protein